MKCPLPRTRPRTRDTKGHRPATDEEERTRMASDRTTHETAVSTGTPTADGFRMPAEFEPHERCLICWPTRSRAYWGDYYMLAQATLRRRGARHRRLRAGAGDRRRRRGRRRARLLRFGQHRGRRAAHRRLLGPRQRPDLPPRPRRRARRRRLPLQLLGRALPPLRQGRRASAPGSASISGCGATPRRSSSRAARSPSTARGRSSPPRAACSTRIATRSCRRTRSSRASRTSSASRRSSG